MTEFTITALVKPGSKRREITVSEDGRTVTIRTTKRAMENRANEDVVDIVADHFRVPKTCVSIYKGHTGKRKIIKIMAP